MKKICVLCEKEFITNFTKKIYCCRKCKDKASHIKYYKENREKVLKYASDYQKEHYVKKDRTNDKYERDEFGHFLKTTGGERYKRIMRNGKNLQLSRYTYERHFGKIPDGYIIHHINEDKKDNRIENLKLMTYVEHNQLHSHPAWNKGLKCPNISESKMGHSVSEEQIDKTKETWKNKYIDSMKQIDSLKRQGYGWGTIGDKLNLTKYAVIGRHRRYTKDYMQGGDILWINKKIMSAD